MKTIRAKKEVLITTPTGNVDFDTIMSKPTIEIKTHKDVVFGIARNNLVNCGDIDKECAKAAFISQEDTSATRAINIPQLQVSAGYDLATKCSLWDHSKLRHGWSRFGISDYTFPSAVAVVRRDDSEMITVSEFIKKSYYGTKVQLEKPVLVYADKNGNGVCMKLSEMKAKFGKSRIFSSLIYGCPDQNLPQAIYILS